MKTRLIPALGAIPAAQLASAMLLDTWRTVESCAGVRPVLATTRLGEFPMNVPADNVWLQGEGDLGARIERILTRGLASAPAAIALGADSPALTIAHLNGALEGLRTHDAAAGPSMDGGFYLLALRRCPPRLFDSLPWSNAKTWNALRDRLCDHAFSVTELEPLFDVDTPADLQLLRACSAGTATTRWCREHKARLANIRPCE